MKDAATKSYSKKGDAIVKMNHDAIERGVKEVKKVEVPEEWAKAADDAVEVKAAATGREEIWRLYRQHPDSRSTLSRATSCRFPPL